MQAFPSVALWEGVFDPRILHPLFLNTITIPLTGKGAGTALLTSDRLRVERSVMELEGWALEGVVCAGCCWEVLSGDIMANMGLVGALKF